jgi:DNA replication and repair protein RecF
MLHSVQDIKLINFRNYEGDRSEFSFFKDNIFIIGPNASGKSNLLDAIQYSSFRIEDNFETEKQLLCFTSPHAFFGVECRYSLHSRNFHLKIVSQGNKKLIQLNGVHYRSLREIRDDIPKSVCFKSKDSIGIITGSPSQRREWLDLVLSLLDVRYAEAIRKYKHILEQRNNLLKTFFERKDKSSIYDELEPWDNEITKYGFYVQQQRASLIQKSSLEFYGYYDRIAHPKEDKAESATLKYLPSCEVSSKDEYFQLLLNNRERDCYRGQTSIGPHRDDFESSINGKSAKLYGSQGQQRTCALALKLLQLHKWQQMLGYSPILLLDDVMAELDLERQKRLFLTLPEATQVFITTTHLLSLPQISSDCFQIITLPNN